MTGGEFRGPSPAEGVPSARVMRAVRELRLVTAGLAAEGLPGGVEPELLRLAVRELLQAGDQLVVAVHGREAGVNRLVARCRHCPAEAVMPGPDPDTGPAAWRATLDGFLEALRTAGWVLAGGFRVCPTCARKASLEGRERP